MSTDEKKAELEANGYEVSSKSIVHKGTITFDTTWWSGTNAIAEAYAHLQERRELEALKRWAMAILDGNEAEYNQVIKDNITEADDDESDSDNESD